MDKRAIFKSATSDECDALLLLNAAYEVIPLAFRMQKNLTIDIPLSEYVKFCDSLTVDNCLASDDTIRQNALVLYKSTGDVESKRGLLACYALDIAFGICKELYYAGCVNREPTILIPSVPRYAESAIYDRIRVMNLSPKINKVIRNTINDMLAKRGYNYNTLDNVEHTYSYKLASTLVFLSLSELIWYYRH